MKIFTIQDKIKFTAEQIILLGLPSCTFNKQDVRSHLYESVKAHCTDAYEYVNDPFTCDTLVLPYKFKGVKDETYVQLLTLSKTCNKPLVCFYNDDDIKTYSIDDNVLLFRTSIDNTRRLFNEFALSTISAELYSGLILSNHTELSVGFCGSGYPPNRRHYLKLIEESAYIKTNFIIRNGFNAPGIPKEQARSEYYKNIEENLFTFCYRGAGNFSYRFYEVLSMGRIPILINTDCVIPFWDDIVTSGIIIIDENDTMDVVQTIRTYYDKHKHNLEHIQTQNRDLYIKYFSPIGFLKNIQPIITNFLS